MNIAVFQYAVCMLLLEVISVDGQSVSVYQCYIKDPVCPSVTDVTSLPQRVIWERGYNVYHNAYTGNESPNCWSARGRHWSALISRHSHSYRRATKARQTTLEQAKTVLSMSRTLSQATKVRLRYKRVDFLGTANRIISNGRHVDLHRR